MTEENAQPISGDDNNNSNPDDDKDEPNRQRQLSTDHASVMVEIEGGLKSKEPTSVRSEGGTGVAKHPANLTSMALYGRPVMVTSSGGNFPNIGSALGPFFSLGQLGKGTFSSIHKCINMQYFHYHQDDNSKDSESNNSELKISSNNSNSTTRMRLAAAKVELSTFQQSGVLEGEATVLEFLYRHLPTGTVPMYMGHYRSDKFAAIVMEYLPGEDMHAIREKIMEKISKQTNSRRISLEDAVFFAADVMLPLLRAMHEVGIVHRDVKPSNVVRRKDKDFCIVDFGLSKSMVEPEDSDDADKEHPWRGKNWLKLLHCKGDQAYYRKERSKADFRGTSMYASLRVHQGHDYCPRDDIWSLLYVFCDLVSGGLPWMSHAATRNREGCRRAKEWLHGEQKDADTTEKGDNYNSLLKGDEYHVAIYERERGKEARVDPKKLRIVPEPLEMSNDAEKVECIREAFQHVSKLNFWDMPDYDLIRRCIHGFLQSGSNPGDPVIDPMDWTKSDARPDSPSHQLRRNNPEWELVGDVDPLTDKDFENADKDVKPSPDDFWSRLPVRIRFQLAQLDYNLSLAKAKDLSPERVLRDWMQVVLFLLYEEWDARQFEDGGHRTATDGFKRERYLELLNKCDLYAREFQYFGSREFFFDVESRGANSLNEVASNDEVAAQGRKGKRRKVIVSSGTDISDDLDIVFVSRTLYGLQHAIKTEQVKKAPPPVRIAFA